MENALAQNTNGHPENSATASSLESAVMCSLAVIMIGFGIGCLGTNSSLIEALGGATGASVAEQQGPKLRPLIRTSAPGHANPSADRLAQKGPATRDRIHQSDAERTPGIGPHVRQDPPASALA